MRLDGLSAQVGYKKYRGKTSGRPSHVADNILQRQFQVTEPNKFWVTDITYSVPGVQGKHGCLNVPRVYLKYINIKAEPNVFVTKPGCAGLGV